MSAGVRAALLVALSVALLGVAVAGHGVASPDTTRQVTTPGDGPSLTMVVDVRSDGDARWTVSTSFNLTSEAERESFRSLAESFENGETSALGLQAFRRASREASEATGREMAIVDIQRRTSPESVVQNGTGRLSITFTWRNFARTEGNSLYVSDVFRTGGGETWLPGLDAGDSLVIRAPRGYGVVAANVAPEVRNNRSVLEWTGPATLNATVLSVEFTGQAATTPTPTETPTGPERSFPWPLAFTLGLGGGVVAVYLLARRRGGFDLPPSPTDEGDTSETSHAGSTTEGDGTDDTEAAPESTVEETEKEESTGIDEELLSDEERVERLLEQNGGRMKQANIVKETGWSNAKVSQLLSAMEDDGRIDKLRIGRENLISFPDEDVTDLEE